MLNPRSDFSAVVSGNSIFVFGGCPLMSACEEYDPVEDRFVIIEKPLLYLINCKSSKNDRYGVAISVGSRFQK